MDYKLLQDVIKLLEEFNNYGIKEEESLDVFLNWAYDKKCMKSDSANLIKYQDWINKNKGRSIESEINTLIVHLSKYAKIHSKEILVNSGFTSQEDFIYLITLKSFGEMNKIDLIRKNIQEKPAGIKIINRLIKKGFINQHDSSLDKRNKIVSITDLGLEELKKKQPVIKKITNLITGDLTSEEKHQLVYLLQKLDKFHNPIYMNIEL